VRRRTSPAEPAPPVLDPSYLRDLAEESTTAAAESFAAAYAALLPERADRIIHSVGTGNRHQGLEAVLSLKTASSLAGAMAISRLCQQLEESLVNADMATALAVSRDISLHVPYLFEALAARPPIT
jgi:HPt (histidine-containing phosphotransfer) domain-containing protein